MKKLSIYIHIPFCVKKCAYCDFVSFKYDSDWVQKYVKKLVGEIKTFDSSGYVVDSIFIGGGTPTLLEEGQLAEIIGSIKSNFSLDLKEFTIEGNPNSYTKAKVDFYQSIGVSRLSVGVQSLNDEVLKGIGRLHSTVEAEECLKMLVASGLDINVDMMVGLPYQTMDIVKEDITKVAGLGVSSVSCYSLILEENTPLYEKVSSGDLILPDEDMTVDMYDLASNILRESGFDRYEISNFGKPCYHNVGYWTLKEYVGFGLSAHSFLGNTRYYNTSNFNEYLSGVGRLIEEKLTLSDMQKEYIMLSLRMDAGIDLLDFRNKFGDSAVVELASNIDKNKKYYNINKDSISIKPEFIYISNSLIAELI